MTASRLGRDRLLVAREAREDLPRSGKTGMREMSLKYTAPAGSKLHREVIESLYAV
jgi:hypothetical protein